MCSVVFLESPHSCVRCEPLGALGENVYASILALSVVFSLHSVSVQLLIGMGNGDPFSFKSHHQRVAVLNDCKGGEQKPIHKATHNNTVYANTVEPV